MPPRLRGVVAASACVALAFGGIAVARNSSDVSVRTPSVSAGSRVELPNGRYITPAGTTVTADDFPGGIALSKGLLFVAGSGEGTQTIGAVDATTLQGNYTSGGSYSGPLAIDPSGTTLFAPGGGTGAVQAYSVANPPQPGASYTLPGGRFAGGVALSPDGKSLFVTVSVNPSQMPYQRGSELVRIPVAGGVPAIARVGNNPWPVATATVQGTPVVAVGNEDDATVSVLNAKTLHSLATIKVGRHPSNLAFTPDGKDLVVVSSLDDRVDDINTAGWHRRSRLSVSSPAGIGATPTGLALAPGGRAYVTLAQDNAVGVLSGVGSSLHLDGRIPTAWWPSSVVYDAASHALLLAAGKGVDENYPTPGTDADTAEQAPSVSMSGTGTVGTLERLPVPTSAQLASYSKLVADNNGWNAPVSKALACSPPEIKHVVLIVRENKTYDEELGDEPGGDATFDTYPKAVTPNTHALAERSGLLTAFYADEEFSDVGHQALAAGLTSDWDERFMLMNYGGNGPVEYANYAADANGKNYNVDKIQWGPSDYLIDEALRHGLSVRNFGHSYENSQSNPAGALDPRMTSRLMHKMPGYGWDLSVKDQARAAFWIKQFHEDVAAKAFPQFEVVYLPDDHTGYYSDGQTPADEVADNDLATGQIVDALSHSSYWSSSAVFVEEDDAQSGVDHIEMRRTVGAVISPWTKSGYVSTVHHDQASMLRSIESILHLPALTEVDATATPFFELWDTQHPNLAPYTAITPTVPAGPAAAARNAFARRVAKTDLADLPVRPGQPMPPDALSGADQVTLTWLAAKGRPFDPMAYAAPTGIQGSGETNKRVGPVGADYCR